MSSRLHPEDTQLLLEPETGLLMNSSCYLTFFILAAKSSRRLSESQNADFMLIKIVARICLTLIRRCNVQCAMCSVFMCIVQVLVHCALFVVHYCPTAL